MRTGFTEALKSVGSIKVDPIPLRKELTPGPPYPSQHLGTVASAAVEAIAMRVQVPTGMAAHSVLASMSLAVQGHVVAAMPTGEVKPTSLFFTTIADSGERKTGADKIASLPIERFEADLHAGYRAEKDLYDAAFKLWKDAKDTIVKECKGFDQAHLRSELEEHGAPPTAPMLPMLIAPAGSSTQGVIHALEHGRPSIGLYHNDGGAWLGGWAMQDENLTATIAAYSDLWDGKPIKTLTKGEGFKFLPGRAFSFHVMFQTHYLDRMFGNVEMREQGFLARMLTTQPTSLAGERLKIIDAVEPQQVQVAIDAYHDRLDRIVRAPLPINAERANALERRTAQFDADASRLYWEFYNAIEVQQGKDGALRDIRGFAGKAAEQAGRLAAVIHIFDHGLRNLTIGPEAMSAGCALMNFYISEALRLMSQGPEDEETRHAEQISKLLAGWEADEIGLSQVQDATRLGRKLKADGIRQIMQVLERHDHVTRIQAGVEIGGRRYREAWRIHVGR